MKGGSMDKLITDSQKAYVAGFLDGDGCIGIYRVKRRRSSNWHYVLNVIFSQSRGDKMKVLKRIEGLYGGYIVKIARQPGAHQAWALRMTGEKATQLIDDVYGFLYVRKKQATLALKFMEYKNNHSGQKLGCLGLPQEYIDFYEECRIKMNWYNRRGRK